MSLSYFNVKKLRRQSKQQDSLEPATATAPASSSNPAPIVSTPSQETAASPMLDEEDEAFMARLAAIADGPEGEKPPLPSRPVVILDGGEKKVGRDAQEALMAGADKVPLPMSPTEVIVDEDKTLDKAVDEAVESAPTHKNEKGGIMSYFALAQSKFRRGTDKYKEETKEKKAAAKLTEKERKTAADDLLAAAESSKSPEQTEEAKEKADLTNILDQLNLSAVNNRVFSFSKESEELMNKFKLVLKDIVNGVPTAYDDLEKLLTGSEDQLQKMFGALPPFLQTMVKSLPAKMTAALGPELLAAQAEKPGFDAKQYAKTSAKNYVKKQTKIPSLKSLVSAQGAVATMLRSILNFLKLRFPLAVTGTNVLMSLAVFLLLFVFWYCHKRGREVRIEKEKLVTDGGDPALDSGASFTDDGGSIMEEGESSKTKEKGKTEPPLILNDDKEATVNDMPSVSHLPDPNSAPLPATPQKEEPLKVPVSK